MVLLTLVIAVLDLCLGYAIGTYLGYGPPTLWDAWEALSLPRPVAERSGRQATAMDQPLPSLDLDLQLETSSFAASEEESDPATVSLASILEQSSLVITQGASRLTALAARVADHKKHNSREPAWGSVVELQEICDWYMRQLETSTEELQNGLSQTGDAFQAAKGLEDTILDQLAQLETTSSNLQQMDFDADSIATQERLLGEIDRMLAAGDRLQSSLDGVLSATDQQSAQ